MSNADLVAERDELQRQIDDLRAFEREYRARLIAYLEGLLAELKGSPDARSALVREDEAAMSIFRKRRPEADPIAYTRAHTSSPSVHALLDEVERGRARQAAMEAATDEDGLHAWNMTANDLQLLWMAQGSTGAGITLPSGITVRNEQTWARLLREAAEMGER